MISASAEYVNPGGGYSGHFESIFDFLLSIYIP